MTAFFVSTSKIKDPEKLQEYVAKAGPTFGPFKGELLTKGKAGDTLVGASDHDVVAVAQFPDMDTLKAWYNSPEYQALIELRDQAVDMTMVTYEVF